MPGDRAGTGRVYDKTLNLGGAQQIKKSAFTPVVKEPTVKISRGTKPFPKPEMPAPGETRSLWQRAMDKVPKFTFVKTPAAPAVKEPLLPGPDFFEAAKAEGTSYTPRAASGLGLSSKRIDKLFEVTDTVTRLIAPPVIAPRSSVRYLPKVTNALIGGLKTTPLLFIGERQVSVPGQILRPVEIPAEVSKSAAAIVQVPIVKTITIPAAVNISGVAAETIRVPTPEIVSRPQVPPGFPIIDPMTLMLKKKKKEKRKASRLFSLQIRTKGQYVPVPGLMVKGKALARGERIARQTPIASFKVVPTSKFISAPDVKFKPSPFFFRSYELKKGKPVQLKDEYIQRRRRRIFSTGEVAGISWKGAAATRTLGGQRRRAARQSMWKRSPAW
jgi:hypothetical protein